MQEKFVLVVGDKFAQFATGKAAITISHLKALLVLPAELVVTESRMVLVPGQGLGEEEIARVAGLAAASPQQDRFDLRHWNRRSPRADGQRSHKHHPVHTLISEPRRLAEDHYEMDLLIDDGCELMTDHQTGQHLPGTLLFEAARQSLLAVTEAFFLPQDGGKHEFILKEMSASYDRFVFPLDARLDYVIRAMDIKPANRKSFTVDVAIEQAGEKAASFCAQFAAHPKPRLGAFEGALAAEALRHQFAQAEPDGSLSEAA